MPRNSTELMGTPDELFYWVPGEMVVVVRLHRRPNPDTQDLLVEQIRSQLNSLLARYSMILEPYGTYGRWSDIPTMPPVLRRSFVFGFHRQQPFIAIFFHVRHVGAFNTDPMPLALSYLQAHLEELAQAGLNVVSAMPNWLVTVAPQLHSDGGPAVPPRPAPQLDLAAADSLPV
ncbi:MAG TPA: hypothetical protein VEL49_08375, partial [Ktedonobacteraceae bacterium]|nr:hypothetical protein [Ktedonobacteraceae bacterium]